jgi:prepilin-type N-terminal cleavage/methylation domain-containing protein
MLRVRWDLPGEDGFTLIELLIAMTVFSFMLLIVMAGFINIVHLHNQALASNVAQDNARTAMDEVVQAVRDSYSVVEPLPLGTSNQLCLQKANSAQELIWVDAAAGGILKRGDNCASPTNVRAISSNAVKFYPNGFSAKILNASSATVKPEVEISMTVASSNGTAPLVGGVPKCGPTAADRTFCSVVDITSLAVPR